MMIVYSQRCGDAKKMWIMISIMLKLCYAVKILVQPYLIISEFTLMLKKVGQSDNHTEALEYKILYTFLVSICTRVSQDPYIQVIFFRSGLLLI